MSEFYISVLIILSMALIVWISLSNELYLKLYFLDFFKSDDGLFLGKMNNKNKSIDYFFDKSFKIPKYIKQAVVSNPDSFKLLSYYYASKELINYEVFFQELSSKNNIKINIILKLDLPRDFKKVFLIRNLDISFDCFLKVLRFLVLLPIIFLIIFFQII